MAQEVQVIKETPFQARMNWQLVEQWAEIPRFSENDPSQPEWTPTITFPLDLTRDGYGVVHIKDESSNPTGTIKDRPAWELATLFRDYAHVLEKRKKAGEVNGNLGEVVVPRFTYVTAGNVGRAVSERFAQHGLPPIKLLVDSSIPSGRLEILRGLHADVYVADLKNKSLTPEEIKRLTNNEQGIDITSAVIIDPQVNFYDWHVHEAFNESPNEIYVPYGSGRLMENYLTHQFRNARNTDPRLKIPVEKLVQISILGGESQKTDSIADKVAKPHNPFTIYGENDFDSIRDLAFTGKSTRVYFVREEKIDEAYNLLRQNCDTEPSGAVGLALYLQRFEEGKVSPRNKILVVNTGKGI